MAVAAPKEQAADLAARLPELVIAARKLAHSVMHGVHGRRRAGPGENFWQFRPFASGEPANRIDWRRSARGTVAFVREREWEAAQTLWLWFDRSATMNFRSDLGAQLKVDRAAVLTLALADLAVRGGERVGLVGLSRAIAARDVIDRFAEILSHHPAPSPLPPPAPVAARSRLVLIGDFLSPPEEIDATFAKIGALGTEGGTQIELIEAIPLPDGSPSPIAGFIAKNSACGQHHLCYEVEDVDAARAWFEGAGKRILGPTRIGAHGVPIFFLHPKDMLGQLTEIMQRPKGAH